jgi:hypothetical protein
VLGLLAGLAVLALLYGSARHQVSSRQAKAVALEAQAQKVQANAGKLAPYTAFIALRDKRLQAVSQLVDSRFDWAHSFHELGRVLPGGVSVSSVTGTIGGANGSGGAASSGASGVASAASSGSSTTSGASSTSPSAGSGASGGAVTSATPPGSVPTFTITGCAVSQSAVALTLERLRLMDGASTVTLQSSTKNVGSSGGGGSGSCPSGVPAFTVQVAFDALPVASTVSTSKAKSIGGKG